MELLIIRYFLISCMPIDLYALILWLRLFLAPKRNFLPLVHKTSIWHDRLCRYATASARSDGMFLLCGGRDASGTVWLIFSWIYKSSRVICICDKILCYWRVVYFSSHNNIACYWMNSFLLLSLWISNGHANYFNLLLGYLWQGILGHVDYALMSCLLSDIAYL